MRISHFAITLAADFVDQLKGWAQAFHSETNATTGSPPFSQSAANVRISQFAPATGESSTERLPDRHYQLPSA